MGMDACPHCAEQSIRFTAKIGADPASPACCPVCQGHSYVANKVSASISVGIILLACAWGVIAALANSALPLYAIIPSTAWFFYRTWQTARLLPIETETVERHRRARKTVTLLAFLLSFFM